MELQDFIASTLTQIVDGVRQAQAQVGDSQAKLNPRLTTRPAIDKTPHIMGLEAGGALVFPVVFNVAVTEAEAEAVKGRAGIHIMSIFNLGAEAEGKASATSANRIRFTVPVALPEME